MYPQILYFAPIASIFHCATGQLTVERGCSHCKLCREVERSVYMQLIAEGDYLNYIA